MVFVDILWALLMSTLFVWSLINSHIVCLQSTSVASNFQIPIGLKYSILFPIRI